MDGPNRGESSVSKRPMSFASRKDNQGGGRAKGSKGRMAQQNGTTGLRSIIITEWLLRSVSVQGGGMLYFFSATYIHVSTAAIGNRANEH